MLWHNLDISVEKGEMRMKLNKLIMLTSLTVMCFSVGFHVFGLEAQAAKKKSDKEKVKKTQEVEITDYSAVFNAEEYYMLHPDLQEVIGMDEEALFQHFKNFGMREGRSGRTNFNLKAYMMNNLDVVADLKADDLSEYYEHYIVYGCKEGRVTMFLENQQLPENMLSTYTTYYDATQERATNVEVAASKINGKVIAPGESFSYHRTVGDRTRANGYVPGPAFSGGKVVSAIGGGICQVSSNLYVSLLLAGIEPTEHHYHGLPVDYVPKGLDAVIAKNIKDLKFKNTTNHNIIIDAVAKDGVLTVNLLRG